jgi:hypothetical protein
VIVFGDKRDRFIHRLVLFIHFIVFNCFQELDCLEDNLQKLSDKCKNAIGQYTEEVDEDPEISEIFVRACKPFWNQYCQVSIVYNFYFCCDNYEKFFKSLI